MGKSGLGKGQNKRSMYKHHIDICYLTTFQKIIVRVECISNKLRGKILKNKGLRENDSRLWRTGYGTDCITQIKYKLKSQKENKF